MHFTRDYMKTFNVYPQSNLKCSFPSRICLRVDNVEESMAVLGLPGAEQIPQNHIMVFCESGSREAFGLVTDNRLQQTNMPVEFHESDTFCNVLEVMSEPTVMASVAMMMQIDPIYGYAENLEAFQADTKGVFFHMFLRDCNVNEGYQNLINRANRLRLPTYAPVSLSIDGTSVTVRINTPVCNSV